MTNSSGRRNRTEVNSGMNSRDLISFSFLSLLSECVLDRFKHLTVFSFITEINLVALGASL